MKHGPNSFFMRAYEIKFIVSTLTDKTETEILYSTVVELYNSMGTDLLDNITFRGVPFAVCICSA